MGFRLARQNAHTFEKFIDSDFSAMFYAAMKPISICAIALAALPVLGAPAANYDEAKVPDAPLPDALAVPDGSFKPLRPRMAIARAPENSGVFRVGSVRQTPPAPPKGNFQNRRKLRRRPRRQSPAPPDKNNRRGRQGGKILHNAAVPAQVARPRAGVRRAQFHGQPRDRRRPRNNNARMGAQHQPRRGKNLRQQAVGKIQGTAKPQVALRKDNLPRLRRRHNILLRHLPRPRKGGRQRRRASIRFSKSR